MPTLRMVVTPDAVIYRYLQLTSARTLDLALLSELICFDADLAASWFTTLDLPVEPEQLQATLTELSPADLQEQLITQESRLLQHSGSARLGFDQWRSVLETAVWGSVLWRILVSEQTLEGANGQEIFAHATRFLLALSGVNHVPDLWVAQLKRYRGVAPELIEDASLEHRIFAVIDAVDVGREAEVASLLLDLDSQALEQSRSIAQHEVEDFLKRAQLTDGSEADWAHRIWLRQHIQSMSAGFDRLDSLEALFEAHPKVAGSLFNLAPEIVLADESGERLAVLGNPRLSVSVGSKSSLLAQAFRSGVPIAFEDALDTPVVDRQILEYMQVEAALAVPLRDADLFGLLLIAEDEDMDFASAGELYGQMLARHIERLGRATIAEPILEDETSHESEVEEEVEAFREKEIDRLRELVHEANNPLSIVHNYLHILELRLSHDEEAAAQLKLISSELTRAGNVFARARQVPEYEPEVVAEAVVELESGDAALDLDIRTWAGDLVEIHQGLAHTEHVQLIGPDAKDTSSEPVIVSVVPGKLSQIMTNLVKNALEATPAGGQVELRLLDHAFRQAQPGLMLQVIDTGPGLPDSVLAELTTNKVSDKGGDHQGVGLQVAFRLSAEIGAQLDVVTNRTGLHSGTTFTLFLPNPTH